MILTVDGKQDVATTIGLQTGIVESRFVVLHNIVALSARRAAFDFDGDGRAELVIYRGGN